MSAYTDTQSTTVTRYALIGVHDDLPDAIDGYRDMYTSWEGAENARRARKDTPDWHVVEIEAAVRETGETTP